MKKRLLFLCASVIVVLSVFSVGRMLMRLFTVHHAEVSSVQYDTLAKLESSVGFSNTGLVRITSIELRQGQEDDAKHYTYSDPIDSIAKLVWNPVQTNRFKFYILGNGEVQLVAPLGPDADCEIFSAEENSMFIVPAGRRHFDETDQLPEVSLDLN